MIAYGSSILKDEARGAVLLRRAASRNYIPAMSLLSYWYSDGIGVEADARKATEWTRKAAELGDPNEQAHLGERYHRGLGVTKDRTEALKWYRLAAEQGHGGARVMVDDWPERKSWW